MRSRGILESIRVGILNSAKIVCATLSTSGTALLSKSAGHKPFDVVIIDEAAQAVELSTLIPLQHGCTRVILVGDPQQLPATVISRVAERFSFKQSLFQRLQAANHPVSLLSEQYRMAPAILQFPSKYFYQDRLTTSNSVLERPMAPGPGQPGLPPYLFLDIKGAESRRSKSLCNDVEAR
jgi:senataxin